MAVRKIDLMHRQFGFGEGTCGDCVHCHRITYRSKTYRKCGIYGITHSEASDWRKSYKACGMKNKRPGVDMIIKLVRPEHDAVFEIPGQLSLFDSGLFGDAEND